MFALLSLGVAVMAAGFLLPSSKGSFKDDVNDLLTETKLKITRTRTEGVLNPEIITEDFYPSCYEVQVHEKYTDCLIGMLEGQSYKDLASYIPLFETKLGKECEVIRANKLVILRVFTASKLDGSITSVINETMILENIKNSKGETPRVGKLIEDKTHSIAIMDIPLGLSPKDLHKALNSLQTYYKNDVELYFDRDGNVGYKVYTVKLEHKYDWTYVEKKKEEGLQICIGMGREGAIYYNLNAGMPYASIIGDVGSGKSVTLNSILCNLMMNYTADELEFDLLDLKNGTELNFYQHCVHTNYFTGDVNNAVKHFDTIEKEMASRYQKLVRSKCRNILEYNRKHPNAKMKYRLVVIDEMFSLTRVPKPPRKNNVSQPDHYDKLGDILSKARASGIHFIITTQRPTSDIIPKCVMDHIGIRMGLWCSTAQKSENAIGETGLERIRNQGEGLVNINSSLTRFQGFYISDKKIEEITKKYSKTEKEVDAERLEKFLNIQVQKDLERIQQQQMLRGSGKNGTQITKKR